MAYEVSFLIKIVTSGEETVRQVTVDAAELGRVVKEVNDEQGKLNTKLLDINQAPPPRAFLDINQEKAENCTKNEIFLAVFVHNAYLCSS